MLRILFCLNGPNAVNGPNVWLTRHLPLLAKKGVEPVVLYLNENPKIACRFRSVLEDAGIKTVPVTMNRYLEENIQAIVKAAGSLNPDVFVPNFSVPGYFAARFLRESGVLTVGTLHSDDSYYHDIIDLFVSGKSQWRLSGVVSVSEYLSTLVKRQIDGNLTFLHAPYGAPIPEKTARWMPDRFRMIYSGRFAVEQKRIYRVVAAMGAAIQKAPSAEGIFYGDGPERQKLNRTLKEWNGRIRMGGLLASGEVQSALLEGQAFVLLSDFEGLSIALMEAMACGLVPIVTSTRSGVTDLIEDGVTGMIVPPDNPSAFAEAVKKLTSNPILWKKLSEAARRAVIERGFTTENCANRWVKYLDDLVMQHGRKRSPLLVPQIDKLDLPPQSSRPDGIRVRAEDRRIYWKKLLATKAAKRPLFLWGAGLAGEGALSTMEEIMIPVKGFIDSDPAKKEGLLQGIRIHSPNQFLRFLDREPRPFVLITSIFEKEISKALTAMSMKKGRDFLSSL
jgi:colanic acid/amylovoran biosynthesis glycosyltransferase